MSKKAQEQETEMQEEQISVSLFQVPEYGEIVERLKLIEELLTEDEVEEVREMLTAEDGNIDRVFERLESAVESDNSCLNPDNLEIYGEYTNWKSMADAIDAGAEEIDVLDSDTISKFVEKALSSTKSVVTDVSKTFTGYDMSGKGNNTGAKLRQKGEKAVRGAGGISRTVASMAGGLWNKVEDIAEGFTNKQVQEDIDELTQHQAQIQQLHEDTNRRNQLVADLMRGLDQDEDKLQNAIREFKRLEEGLNDGYFEISISCQIAQEFWNRLVKEGGQLEKYENTLKSGGNIRRPGSNRLTTMTQSDMDVINRNAELISEAVYDLVDLVQEIQQNLVVISQIRASMEKQVYKNRVTKEIGSVKAGVSGIAHSGEATLTGARVRASQVRKMNATTGRRLVNLLDSSTQMEKKALADGRQSDEKRKETRDLLHGALKRSAETRQEAIERNIGDAQTVLRSKNLLEARASGSGISRDRLLIGRAADDADKKTSPKKESNAKKAQDSSQPSGEAAEPTKKAPAARRKAPSVGKPSDPRPSGS